MSYEPPHDPAAEQATIGGMLLAKSAITDVICVIVDGADFYLPKHEQIFNAILTLHGNGRPADAVTVAAELRRIGELNKVGGPGYLHTCMEAAPAASNAGYYAQIVRGDAKRRRVYQLAAQMAQATRPDITQDEDLKEVYEKLLAEVADHDRPGMSERWSFATGAEFVLDVPEVPPAVWGNGSDVLWAEGEALMIAAPQGVGKTTLAFQVVRARLELQPDVLGYKVAPTQSRVLYLAMDRPAQAQRAAARLFTRQDQTLLTRRLVVWKGPPPADMAADPTILAEMCRQADADTVVIDSLKDAAVGLSDDTVGAAYNRARQLVLTAGVQVLELHHTRKAGANGGEPNTISDVYGSTWLTSGAGSVISLYGSPGDPIVSFRHLKQPMNEVGPFKVMHDHHAGTTSVHYDIDVMELARIAGPEGLLASNVAAVLYDTNKPKDADVEKVRRMLRKKVDAGLLVLRHGSNPRAPQAYFLPGSELG